MKEQEARDLLLRKCPRALGEDAVGKRRRLPTPRRRIACIIPYKPVFRLQFHRTNDLLWNRLESNPSMTNLPKLQT